VSDKRELPFGWVDTPLSDCCTIIMGQSPPSSAYNENGEGYPFFQGKAEFTDLRPIVRKWCTEPTKIAETDDVLISVRAPVGPTNLAPSQCCIGRGLAAIRPRGGIEPRYILYAIRSSVQGLADQGTGTTFAAISGDILRKFMVPLAPLAEQRRIVAAIEEQFTRLDAGVVALKSARARLKQYRAAVLKAAVEGELTKAWREAHPDTEPASELLARILAERRARWEAEQRAKGKDPAKGNYREPNTLDAAALSEPPAGWNWASLEQCSMRITDGTHQPPAFVDEGIPFVFVQHIVGGKITFGNTRFISQTTYDELNRRCPVEPGDILYTAVGSYGVAVPVTDEPPFSFQRHIAHIKPVTTRCITSE